MSWWMFIIVWAVFWLLVIAETFYRVDQPKEEDMKSFRVMRNNQPTIVIELSWKDIAHLLLGREIVLSKQMQMIARIPLSYAAFNLRAKTVE